MRHANMMLFGCAMSVLLVACQKQPESTATETPAPAPLPPAATETAAPATEASAPAASADTDLSDGNLRSRCKTEVAKAYAVGDSQITVGDIVNAENAFTIDGSVDKGAEGVKAFACRFDGQRQFIDVMAMTSDGE
jgi:hypothetical protein